MSKSTRSSLLWAFLIIAVAGLVLLILAVAGVATAGIISGIGIILLAAGIVGAGFIIIAPSRTDSSSIDKAAASTVDLPTTPTPVAPTSVAPTSVAAAAVAPAPVTEAPAPAAPAPVAPAEPVAPPAAPVEAAPEPPAPVATAPEPPAPVEAAPEPEVEDAREFPHPAEVASEFSGPAVTTPIAAVTPPPAPVAGTPKQPGFASVQRIGSFHSSGAASFSGDEWVFALASSPTVQHTYRIRARRTGGSAAAWYKGGGIVDILIDNVPTGQFMVIPNKKSAKEDVINGSTYRVEMQITSDGLTASTLDTLVTVDGIPMTETS